MNTIIFTVVILSSFGVVLAVILYFVAQKFKVFEDPRIDGVVEILPGANCGGCGYAGCRAFAEALVKNDDISAMLCPVGGNSVMTMAAERLGKTAVMKDPLVAAVRCAGSCKMRPKTNLFEGAKSCVVMSTTYSGDTGCSFGCLGQGDCAVSCNFDAIRINPETLLPEVDDEKCTACGSCVKACPKFIIELRKKGPKNRRIFVACANKEKGGVARKSCGSACTGCTKCQKVCNFEAITIADNLAYIDHAKCRLCRKCVTECPTNVIRELNFPPKKAE
ncbi:MAG: RnfABCDGE type electron transport complex subunit B [Prevotellaceae bacterium]|jgi:Na+-translocating ferredoxin:NAD+ oxidoreductase RNF subunit RnfB|nr:RnfABCDGE type electron transport complex subunit B [Prevotellaceae bacterium]